VVVPFACIARDEDAGAGGVVAVPVVVEVRDAARLPGAAGELPGARDALVLGYQHAEGAVVVGVPDRLLRVDEVADGAQGVVEVVVAAVIPSHREIVVQPGAHVPGIEVTI